MLIRSDKKLVLKIPVAVAGAFLSNVKSSASSFSATNPLFNESNTTYDC